MPGNETNRGFTLVELMVTLAVLAILATLATPMFGDLIQKNKVDTVSAELTHLLQYARSEAITRGTSVTVKATDSNWVGALEVDAGNEVLRKYGSEGINGSSSVTATASSTRLSFSPSGTLSGETTSLTITLCPTSGSSTVTGRVLQIYGSGQITSSSTECSS
ncbi:GspH/FimT family pseudopilin [Pseudomonas sp. QL9]|uniref:GspH/FimT family pseudopilin n=1 Tax=Pseudomonas sp. QL9 TaxID=3242725 RepID=UPI003529E091